MEAVDKLSERLFFILGASLSSRNFNFISRKELIFPFINKCSRMHSIHTHMHTHTPHTHTHTHTLTHTHTHTQLTRTLNLSVMILLNFSVMIYIYYIIYLARHILSSLFSAKAQVSELLVPTMYEELATMGQCK